MVVPPRFGSMDVMTCLDCPWSIDASVVDRSSVNRRAIRHFCERGHTVEYRSRA